MAQLRRVSLRPGAAVFALLCAGYLVWTAPMLRLQVAGVVAWWSASPEQRLALRTTQLAPLLREVERRVPPDAALLLDVPQQLTDLAADQIHAYWLYPRPVYSARALRAKGVDPEAFASRRGIVWRVEGDRLVYRGEGPPPATAADDRLPTLQLESPMRAVLGALAGLVHFAVVGACLVVALGAWGRLASRAGRVGAAFLLGVGAVGLFLLACFALGLGVGLAHLAASLLAALGVRWLLEPRSPRPEPARLALGGVDRAAAACAALLLVGLAVRAAAVPMEMFDSRYQWAHKAHVMVSEPSLWGPGFQDPDTLHFHPKYPLLVPAAETVPVLYAGEFDDWIPKILFPALVAAFAALLLDRLRPAPGAGLAVLAFALLPWLWGLGAERDGGAGFTGYPDLAVAVFVAAAYLFLLRGMREGSVSSLALAAAFALFAALSKAEGVVHAGVFLVLAAVALRGSTGAGARAGRVALLACALAIALHQLLVVAPTQPGYLPDDDYRQLLTPAGVWQARGRLPGLVGALGRSFAVAPRFGLVGCLLLGAVAWRWRAWRRPELWAPLAHVWAMLLLFAVPYAALPEAKVAPIYFWSAGRLLFQLVPLAFLASAVLLLDPEAYSGEASSGR
jgi:hypothetical protein